ncbi:acyltransferase [Shumkonia mesophila]|uniref:acyltransferase n=1 Tax=Shumkonia mesophila TaxID=2838854 RepID=UPI0029346AC4|nr:acyltransferase [Shumkonia mesophila]
MTAARPTLHFIEWLRIGLVSLVVAHHGAQAYGPTGGAWPVFEAERSQWLDPFFAVNAGFFMGLFFLISGYFVPASLARKGARRFAADRLVRLGPPLVIMGFLVFPFIGYAGTDGGQGFLAYYAEVYIGQWRVTYGPLWFVFHLLVYGLAFASLAVAFPRLAAEGLAPPTGHRGLIGLAVVIAVAGGLVRLEFPQDRWVNFLGVMPMEPAHLPQYLALFVAGTVAGRHRWFETIPAAVGRVWLGVGLAAAVFWYALRYFDEFAGFRLLDAATVRDLFPVWEATLAVGLAVGLVVHFRERWNRPHPWLGPLAGAAYGVFILHVFVVVGLNLVFLGVPLPPFAKFLAVTGLALVLCFAAVILLRRLPGVARVL